jgi:hypothetical protein
MERSLWMFLQELTAARCSFSNVYTVGSLWLIYPHWVHEVSPMWRNSPIASSCAIGPSVQSCPLYIWKRSIPFLLALTQIWQSGDDGKFRREWWLVRRSSLLTCLLVSQAILGFWCRVCSSDFRTRFHTFFEIAMNVKLLQISQRLHILNPLMLMTWNVRIAGTCSCRF